MEADDIKQLRLDLGWTQERLADELGVGRTTVTLWERKINNPSGPALKLLGNLRQKAEKKRGKK